MAVLVFAGTYILFSMAGVFFPVDKTWYRSLHKPPFTPPDGFIRMVWIVLYALISFSVTIMFKTVRLWGLDVFWYFIFLANGAFNYGFSYLMFKRKNLRFAMWCSVVHTFASLFYLLATLPYSSLSALLLVPYFLWTACTAYLTWRLSRLNQ